jgi:D-alanyl-D-alanine carboxypeptidase (penicillin-binding protein 5/6)
VSRVWLAIPLLFLAVVAAMAVNYLRPVPPVVATQTAAAVVDQGGPPSPPWPGQGQAALGAQGAGVLAQTPAARPLPIASVAKVMTALLTVEAKPLRQGEQGPAMTVTQSDVDVYGQDRSEGQSVLAVQAGESLSEYQALQGLLIPSGNNVAQILATWVGGSPAAFVGMMNARARSLGMTRTTFTDPSGFAPETVSVPADLVRLGEVAMDQPAIADVVRQAQATLPVAGIVYNVNYIVGQHGILGIKTGTSPQAQAVYLFAGSQALPTGRTVLVFGAIQNVPTLDAAFGAARTLLDYLRATLGSSRLVARDQSVGSIRTPWGGAAEVVAAADLEVLTWPGTVLRARLEAPPVRAPVAAGARLGVLHVTAGDQVYDLPVVTAQPVFAPGRIWRLTRLS